MQTARYVTVEISDTSNPNNYVQVGRFFAGGGFVPSYNATQLQRRLGRPEHDRPPQRVRCLWNDSADGALRRVQLVLEGLSLDEGDTLHEMQRVLGTIDEVLYSAEPVQHGPVAALRDAGHDRRDVGTGLPRSSAGGNCRLSSRRRGESHAHHQPTPAAHQEF